MPSLHTQKQEKLQLPLFVAEMFGFEKKPCSNFISYLTKSRRPAVWQETKKNRKGSQDDRTHKQVSTRALPSTQVIKQYRANQ